MTISDPNKRSKIISLLNLTEGSCLEISIQERVFIDDVRQIAVDSILFLKCKTELNDSELECVNCTQGFINFLNKNGIYNEKSHSK